ncbi:hypothetical protein A9R01_02985 ['Osedax' symbiont bacterium Rs2_46_30_T18]|nr:hypothetical protein A9R01_02985 ['Osedax' symbiont bacterium Rs2_46_30_T18]
MIELAKTTVAIAAPVGTVFNYVTNMENYIDWFPGVVAIRSANNLAHGIVGKKYLETLSLPEGDVEMEIKVHRSEINKLFLMQGNLTGLLTQMTVRFTADEKNNCNLSLQYHSRNPELTCTSDMIIALREDLAVRAEQGVTRLKALLESM